MSVNWAAYTEEQLRELELLPLAGWSGAQPLPASAAAPVAAGQEGPVRSAPRPDAPAMRREVPAARPSVPVSVAQPAAQRVAQPVAAPVAAPGAVAVQRPVAAALGQADWLSLREHVIQCKACDLCKQRKQTVFGVGAESGPWMFVGEGPGMEEDEQGEPFVGQAGKLLDAMLASIQLSRRTNVYIANVVKCRPPGNRTPTLDEASACAGYLDRQIDLVNPKLIIALGKTAATRLTGQEASLSSQRGKDFSYRGYPVLVTYHPAYLLRNLPDKAKAWEDLVRARRIFAEQG